MKKLSETYKEIGIAFSFPIRINDDNGNLTYFEDLNGYWCKKEFDKSSNCTYRDNSAPCWDKWEYDENGNETYYEDSNGTKKGTPRSAKTCEGKVVEIDGVEYELKAL